MITVVIPAFNRKKYLFPTLNALFTQKVSVPYEVLLVDSGSDGTGEAIKAFFPAVKYISMPETRNRSLARNLGAENALGDILLFLDNDMIVPPGYLQAHIEAHQNHQNLVCLGKRLSLGDFKQEELRTSLYFSQEGLNTDFMEKLAYIEDVRERDILKGGLPFDKIESPWRFSFSHGLSVSKENFVSSGGFDGEFGEHWGYEDVDLSFRLAKLGISFRLLEGFDAYHQPHDNQTVKNLDEGSINRRIFGQKSHCYEMELATRFGPHISVLLNNISLLKKKFPEELVPVDDFKEELVFGCAYSINEEHNHKKCKMGVYIPEEEETNIELVESIRIIKGFFYYDDIIQLTILMNALILTKIIIVEKKDHESLLQIRGLIRDLGVSIEIEDNEDHFIVNVIAKNVNRFIKIILPGIIQPEIRYMNHQLALLLHRNNYRVVLMDLEGKTDAFNEEFSLDKEEQDILSKMKCTHYHQIDCRSIVSENEYAGSSETRFPPGSIILRNRGYTQKSIGRCSSPVSNYEFLDENQVDILNLMSASRIIDSSLTESTFTDVSLNQSKQFLAFMINGFAEDSIEAILKSFVRIINDYPEATLCVKVLDYPHSLENLYTSHNKASKEQASERGFDKYEKNLVRLKGAILDLNLRDNIRIETEASTLSERKELYNQSIGIITASIDNFIGIEGYEALFLNRNLIIPNHKILSTSFDNHERIHKVSATEVSFSKAKELPFDLKLLPYRAHKIDEESLFLVMSKLMNKEEGCSSNFVLPDFPSMVMDILVEIL